MRVLGLLIPVAALAMLLLLAPPGRPLAHRPDAPVADPGAPGPYAVGATVRRATRTLPDGQARTLATRVWYPAAPAAPDSTRLAGATADAPAVHGSYPVVVFSHGHAATPLPYTFLLTHLASHGFVVAAPEHGDCGSCPPGIGNINRWDEDLRRPADVGSVLEMVLALSAQGDPILGGLADAGRAGVVGHSQGGYTALRVLETDPRFLAGAALSPAVYEPPVPDPAALRRPVMIVVGELDPQAPYGLVGRFYERIPAGGPDRWFVAIHRAGHSFTNLCFDGPLGSQAFLPCARLLPQDEVQAILDRSVTAFLQRYVAGDERYTPFLDPVPSERSAYAVIGARTGTPTPTLPAVAPLPGGEGVMREATDLVCRSGRAVPCALLRSGVGVQFGGALGGFHVSPTMLTLDSGFADGRSSDVASLLVGAATYAALDSAPSPSCADVARAETEQALFWTWLSPDGHYPTDSARARRMLQIVRALGPDGTVQLRLDPARAAQCPA